MAGGVLAGNVCLGLTNSTPDNQIKILSVQCLIKDFLIQLNRLYDIFYRSQRGQDRKFLLALLLFDLFLINALT